MTTTVVHVNDPQGFDVYIGRAVKRRGFAGSKWGNPYPLAMGTREQVIEAYRRHLLASPELLAALPELKGKRLGCWCKPLACHGDVRAALATGKVVTWEGESGEDAARRYVDMHRDATVIAWRHVRHGLFIGARPIVEPEPVVAR